MSDQFEMWKIYGTDTLVLSLGAQELHFDILKLGDLKDEIHGWELRYYGD